MLPKTGLPKKILVAVIYLNVNDTHVAVYFERPGSGIDMSNKQ